MRRKIEFDDLPIWRDSTNDFKPLEQLFGALSFGCSFGELSVINVDEDQKRFYSTMAVSNTICVSLSRKRLQLVVEQYEKRLMNDRRDFMLNIEEFRDLSRTALTKLIEAFEIVNCIKNSVVCVEGQDLNYIYFIREGEFEMSKIIRMAAFATEETTANQIMDLAKEDPEPGKITKQIRTLNQKKPGVNSKVHVFGILSKGSYMGLMEITYKKIDFYYTTLTCKSHSGGSLFRIKKDTFLDKFKTSEAYLMRIRNKTQLDYKKLEREIKKMKNSNVAIEDDLKKALDVKAETNNSAIDRNANVLRFFEQNMRDKKMIENNKSKV